MNIPPLWEHQRRDIQRIIDEPIVINASDPGTGKTRTIIESIRHLPMTPVLILAPKSILDCAWAADFTKFASEIKFSVASAENRMDAFNADAQVFITNHDAVKWLVAHPEIIARFNGGMLVIDESTAFKNITSQRTKDAMKLRLSFDRVILMSGTLMTQGILDLWSQVWLADLGTLLGNSFYRYRAVWCNQIQKGNFSTWEEKTGAVDAIGDMISSLVTRNRREDCMDLPENLIHEINIQLSGDHLKRYNEMKESAITQLKTGTIDAVNAAVLRGKLLQIASGIVYDDTSTPHVIDVSRCELVVDLIEARSQSVVVFNWRHQRDLIIKEATKRKIPYVLIDGSVSQKDRLKAVESFQRGDAKFILVHPASAAHGITLTAGEATIWCSPIATVSAEQFVQTNARIHRGGQTKKTETILIQAINTIEPNVYNALSGKVGNMSDLLELLC